MTPPSAEAAALAWFRRHHGYALVGDLHKLGMTKHRVATMVKKGICTRVDRGLVALGTPRLDIWANAMRSVMIAGPHAAAALWTAAQLHDLDAPRDTTIHVVVPGSNKRQPTAQLHVHRTRYLPPEHVTTLKNVPVTSLARTIVDCAQHLAVSPALRVLDSCSASVRTWQEIHRAAERLSNGRAGVRAIADATAPDGAERMRSTLERQARDALQTYGVAIGQWNRTIHDEYGRIREVDLCYAEARLIIELDGLVHHRGPSAAQRDRETDRRLLLAGWRVLRFTWRDVMERPHYFVGQIQDGLRGV
jgi:predicted transcriptional regulator of viral defense system